MQALGLSEEEAIGRGMIPGLALKRFEDAALKMQAMNTVNMTPEQAVHLGLVEDSMIDIFERFMAQFETLDTLGLTYEEGVQMGYMQDAERGGAMGVYQPSLVPSVTPPTRPPTESCASSDAGGSFFGRSAGQASYMERRVSGSELEKLAIKTPGIRRSQDRGGFTCNVGPSGISCSCGGPPMDGEHEIV
jgi:hypothetical protein